MARTKVFPLDSVRADGWFERIGEGIGSFHALCEIVGDRFVAFSLITGARITALSVDRRALDNTIVDFVVGGRDDEGEPEPQRLTLGDFRRRLVAALLAEEAHGPPPARENDTEGIQLFIGIRTLLLSPIYGYSLRKLVVEGEGRAQIEVLHDGLEEEYDLTSFRARLRAHVRDELDRVSSGHRGAIDLGRIAEAESAAESGDFVKVRQLLGTWPAPLAIFLRTPDGQMLGAEARALIAKGLGLLGSACVRLGDIAHGEEIFRLGVQYAQEGGAAGDVFRRLGEALLLDGRPGEAVAALRRAINLGAQGHTVWPLLTRAFLLRKRYVAAYACMREALAAGTPESEMVDDRTALEQALGPGLTAWRAKMVASGRTNLEGKVGGAGRRVGAEFERPDVYAPGRSSPPEPPPGTPPASALVDAPRAGDYVVERPGPAPEPPGRTERHAMVATYTPIFMLLALAILVAGGMFAASHYLGPKNMTSEKGLPFECGSESEGGRHARLSVKFYLTAILFVVFDIEAVFVYPWAVQFRQLGWTGFLTMLSFLSVLVVGLVYCWKKGALEWEN